MNNFSAIEVNTGDGMDLVGGSEINGTIMLEGGDFEDQEVTLKIGDLVSLHVPRYDGYMSAEGILDEDVQLACPPQRFDNCIFQICLRNRVSAAEELAEYDQKVSNGEPVPPSFMDTLRRVKANEQKLNASLMREKSGTDIKYRDVIQLRHVPSGKFLTVSPNEVAKTERENLRVFLDQDGSTYSWFTLESGRAMASGGRAFVDNNSDVVLACTARENEFLHFSANPLPSETAPAQALGFGNEEEDMVEEHVEHEVNCSLEKTSFRMKLFTEYDSTNEDVLGPLHAGELVYLQDPESNSFLRLLEHCEKEGLEPSEAEAAYFHKHHHGDETHSGALWMAERVQSANGGEIEWGQLMTFRHLNTGRYLLMRGDQQVVAFDDEIDDILRPSTGMGSGADSPMNRSHALPKAVSGSTDLREAECALSYEPFSRVGLEDAVVRNMNMVLIHSEAAAVWLCKGARHPKLSLNRAELSNGEEDRDDAVCLVVKRATASVALEVRTPISALPALRQYAEAVGRKDVPKLCKDFPKVQHLIECMVGFCLDGGYVSAESDGVLVTIPSHQTILKQQGVVDLLLDILERETPLIKHAASMTHGDLKVLERLCRKCFQALHTIILKHPLNQLYVADRFTVIIAYLGKGSVAMRTITEMLGTNMEIQENKVGQKEVETFISMLRESRMNFTILKLLSALCSCQGVGIDSNQTLLATLLLDQSDELLVKVVEKGGQLYVNPPGGQHSGHHGAKGKAGESKVQGELISITHLSQRKNRELLKFFVAQLYMYAEMCFDRNYIAMQLLQDQVPYSWIISAINEPEITEELRAAFTRLAHTMYIDCKPQEKFNSKNLTFCWSSLSVEQCKLPAISHQPENGVDGFIAMQQVVTNHLKQLTEGGQWSLFTYQAVASLEALIQFKFYSDQKDLMSVVEPLINGLDFTGTTDLTPEQAKALAEAAGASEALVGKGNRKNSFDKIKDAAKSPQQKNGGFEGTSGSALKYQSKKVVPDGEDDEEEGTHGDNQVVSVKTEVVERRVHRSQRQEDMLVILGSLPMLFFILTTVVVAVVAAAAVPPDSQETMEYKIFDYIVFAIFAIELLCRIWAVNDSRTFMSDGMAIMDAVVVGLDILLMAAEDILSSFGNFSRALRAVRFARLVRVLKVFRLANAISNALEEEKSDIKWEVPPRYKSTPEGKLLTMIQMVKTLINVSNMCGSFRLSMLLAKVKEWHLDGARTLPSDDDERSEEAATSLTNFFDATITEGKTLGLDSAVSTPDKVNDILLDLCLYEQNELVHNALSLLMLHHTPLYALQRNARDAQLMVRREEETLYKELEEKLSELQRSAESEEIWGGLETAEHVDISNNVKQLLRELTNSMRQPAPKLLTKQGMYIANNEVQTVVRNLGGFDVAMTVMELTANLDGDDDEDEEGGAEDMQENAEMENTKDIMRLCNGFLCWFLHDNPANQEIAFVRFEEFRSQLENGLGAAQVLAEMLRDNEKLIKSIGDDFIDGAVELILTKGREPQYLALLDVITHIDDAGREKGLRENQIAVVQQLTEETQQETLLYLPGAPGTPMYEERRQLMQRATDGTYSSPSASRSASPTKGNDDNVMPMDGANLSAAISAVSGGGGGGDALGDALGLDPNSHLPGPLRYHTKLLMTLAGCAAGMINIVEAKVQSLCTFQNVLFALLDPETLTEVRTALARFFYDVIIDVQILVPMLCENEQVWAYLSTFPEVLERACIATETLEREAGYLGTRADRSDMRQMPTKPEVLSTKRFRPERALLCYCLESLVPICLYFFTNYYDPLRTPWHQEKIECLLGELYVQLQTLAQMNSPLFMDEDKDQLSQAMAIVLDNCSQETQSSVDVFAAQASTSPKMQRKASMSEHMMALMHGDEQKRGSTLEHDAIKEAFTMYMGSLDSCEGLDEAIKVERSALIKYLKEVPRLGYEGKFVEFRFEPLLEKLVGHIRQGITFVGDKKQIDQDHTDTALWVIELFRGMIEHEWGFTINERDDEGDDDSDEKVEPQQRALDDCGATALCLDLIAEGIAPSLVMESVKLLIALLYREGGCDFVQTTIYEHLNNQDAGSQFFFAKVQNELKDITAWHVNEWQSPEDVFTQNEEEEPAEHDSLIIVRFLQLCCEGHYGPNQDIFRTQPNNPMSYNLLTTLVEHTSIVSRMECRVSTLSLASITDTILEVIQGPCVGNQSHFAINTELLETLNRMIRTKPINDQVGEEEDEVKVTCMCIFKALVEGQPAKDSMIYNRILSVVHVEVLEQLITGEWGKEDADEEDGGDEMDDLQIQSLVLMQMLQAYQPELANDMKDPENVKSMLGNQVVGIEIVWDGVLQQRYFPVPEMCQTLSDPSKDDITMALDRSSLELSLEDFVKRTHMMHVELQHEMWMKSMGLGAIFSRSSQNNSTWLAFFLCCTCNWIAAYSLKYNFLESKDLSTEQILKYNTTLGNNNYMPIFASEVTDEVEQYQELCESTVSTSDFPFKFYAHAEGESKQKYVCEKLDFTNNWHKSVSTEDLQYIVNIAQIVVASFTMILFFAVRVPVIFRQKMEIDNKSTIVALIMALTDPMTIYYILYVAICVLALNISPFWSSLLLLDIVVKSATTADVLIAVIKPIKQLAMTVVLGGFMLFIFAFITFLVYHNDMPDDECNTLMRCFQLTTDFGLRSSGGVGDYMSMDRAALGMRNILDLAYFIIILVILLNIIFGIIIDTFSELRQEKLDRVDKTVNFCFVCGKTKLEFDRASAEPHGFIKHIQRDHYMWNYLRFMIFLWEQDQDDDDGLELYVRKCLENSDFTWFPQNKAMCLEVDDDEEEKPAAQELQRTGGGDESVEELRKLVEEMKKAMEDKLDKVDKQVSSLGNPMGGLNSSPSFRVGINRQSSNPNLRHTTGSALANPMQEAQRLAERAASQQQAEDLPPLS